MISVVNKIPMRSVLRRLWGRVRWKIAAIMVFTGASTILISCSAIAVVNVLVRRESANVVEKQIQILVQASRSVASAILDNTSICTALPGNSSRLKRLVAYTDEAFPQAEAAVMVEGADRPCLLAGANCVAEHLSNGAANDDFTGLVVDHEQLEIRNVVTRREGSCRTSAVFNLPLGTELARRLSSASSMEVAPVSPKPFRVHPGRRVFQTIEGNFIPGITKPASVVLTVRNSETGALEDWIAYTARPSYSATFEGVARMGSQLANWVVIGTSLALLVMLMDAAGLWMCLRLGGNIAIAMDDLSRAAREIATGNLAWRTPIRGRDQLGDLSRNFNEMVISLERLQQEEAAALRIESELQVARSVQAYLFPRAAPILRGVTVSGKTVAARTVGGDLYDFFDLGKGRLGILCADVSGKGVPAALMMANLQAVARAHLNERTALTPTPGDFVEILNRDLTGRFGDNRYATLCWADYKADTSVLTYINAANPASILISPDGHMERLESDGFPVGMFAKSRYLAKDVQMRPGSLLVIFSDGLVDAQNTAGEDFGEERLISCCRNLAPGMDAEGAAGIIMKTVAEWSAGTEQFDDTTVVVMGIAA